MTHIMIDLETLGTKPGSVIRSIGAVLFDPLDGTIDRGTTFYCNISRESCERIGLTVDAATEEWWASQSDEAKQALESEPFDIDDALAFFCQWWATIGGTRFWANDPDFDGVILSAAYAAAGLSAPWPYNAARSCRTMGELTGIKPDRTKGTHHTALDDAINQAQAVIDAYAALKIGATT